jgi:hypothetical protein
MASKIGVIQYWHKDRVQWVNLNIHYPPYSSAHDESYTEFTGQWLEMDQLYRQIASQYPDTQFRKAQLIINYEPIL